MSNYIKIKQVIGVEVILLEDEKYIINTVQLSNKRNVLGIDQTHEAVSDITELPKIIDKEIALSVSVNGRGILHKKVLEKFKDDRRAIQHLLPNAKAEDFYIQECASNKGFFYSIVRKQILDRIVKELTAQGFSVIHLKLGPFAVAGLFPVLKDVYSLNFGGHSFTIKNTLIEDYFYSKDEASNEDIKIDELKIKEGLLIAFSSAFQILVPINQSVSFELETIEEARNEYLEKLTFKFTGWTVLLFFLSVLLVNFFLFNSFQQEKTVLQAQQSKFTGLITNLDTLQKKVKQREEFLAQAGWSGQSRISFYSDQIASLVPASVLLTELSVNPVDQVLSKKEKKLLFQTNIINISGICNKPTDLNPWIKEINKQDWVDKVQVNNYSFDNEEGKGSFLITIQIK